MALKVEQEEHTIQYIRGQVNKARCIGLNGLIIDTHTGLHLPLSQKLFMTTK